MLEVNRDYLNLFAMFLVMVLFFGPLGYILVVPLLGIFFKIAMKYSDKSVQDKRQVRWVYTFLRIVSVFVILEVPLSGIGIGGLLLFAMLVPVAYLEALAVFDIPYPPSGFVGIPLYVINLVSHMIAVLAFYYGLQLITIALIAFSMAMAGVAVI